MESYLPDINNCRLVIIGLGYVGLPLAIEFYLSNNSKINRKIIGFDINQERVQSLNNNYDSTGEQNLEELNLKNIKFTSNEKDIIDAELYIVSVPTPVKEANIPDLSLLENASRLVGNALRCRKILKDNKPLVCPVVVFESTVYPGATEEISIPIIEKSSGLKLNIDFFCGYSPERINPGKSNHKLKDIVKVTSGSSIESANWIDKLYSSIIKAGTYKAKSIKVAEAAKIIENTQRDINIALINELAIICENLNIDTNDVIDAAETKWNFLPFRPGLVGGHCIGIDPYYLTFKAQSIGYKPQVVLSGREMNDTLPKWITHVFCAKLSSKELIISKTNILIIGLAFKPDCPDTRNTRVKCLIKELKKYGINPDIYDPIISKENVDLEDKKNFYSNLPFKKYKAIIVAVSHKETREYTKEKWLKLMEEPNILFDLTNTVPRELATFRL